MILGIIFLIILASVAVRGGDLRKLSTVQPRHRWTVATSILIQVVIITIFAEQMPAVIASALHLASYGLALTFVWFNRKTTGIAVIMLGGVLNLIAIVANGGVMPASAAALEFAGKPVETGEFENSAVHADAQLQILGDVFALPNGMPFANVFSLGDIVLLVGGYILVSRACLSPKDEQIANLRQEIAQLVRLVDEKERDVATLKDLSRGLLTLRTSTSQQSETM